MSCGREKARTGETNICLGLVVFAYISSPYDDRGVDISDICWVSIDPRRSWRCDRFSIVGLNDNEDNNTTTLTVKAIITDCANIALEVVVLVSSD